PPKSSPPVLLTEDHSGFVVERSFEYKLTLGFPSNDRAWFIPSTKTRMIVLWLRMENLSQQPLELDISKFSSTDEEGRKYPDLTAEEAFDRIIAAATVVGPTLGTNMLNRMSLGKAGKTLTGEQIKEDIIRYSIKSGPVSPRGIIDGLIYFEAPAK